MALPSQTRETPSRPVPSHRHAAPSGPWPWRDLDSDLNATSEPEPKQGCHHTTRECDGCWAQYPQSLFPNWTPSQVRRSAIADICAKTRSEGPCLIHYADVYHNRKSFSADKTRSISEENKEEFWEVLRDSVRHPWSQFRNAPIIIPTIRSVRTAFAFAPCSWTTCQCLCCRCLEPSQPRSVLMCITKLTRP